MNRPPPSLPFIRTQDTLEFNTKPSTIFFLDCKKNKRKDPLFKILDFLGVNQYIIKTSTLKTLCQAISKYSSLFDYTISSNSTITYTIQGKKIVYSPFMYKNNTPQDLNSIIDPFFTDKSLAYKVIELNKILGIRPHYEKKSEQEYIFKGLQKDIVYQRGNCELDSSDWTLILETLGVYHNLFSLSNKTICRIVDEMLESPKQVLFHIQHQLYIIRLQGTSYVVDYTNPDKYLSYNDKNTLVYELGIQKYVKYKDSNFAIRKYIKEYLNRWENLQKTANLRPLVQRWIDFPHFFIPIKNIELEGVIVTLYKIPKGSILYHGSVKDFDPKDMNWLSFFSPHEKISEMILSFTGKGWYSIEQGQLVIVSYPMIYKFRTKKDVFVIYNTNMGLPISSKFNKYGQFSPVNLQQSMEDFCAKHKSLVDGFFDLRDAAPIFPIFLDNPTQQDIKDLEDPVFFAHKYLKIGSYDRQDPIYTMEVILCNPQDSLELVEKKKLDGLQLIQEWISFSIQVLKTLKTFAPNTSTITRQDTIDNLKYDYILGKPILDPTRRFYNDGYVNLNNLGLISTRSLELKDFECKQSVEIRDIVLPNQIPKDLDNTRIAQFWLDFCLRNKRNPKLEDFYRTTVLPFLYRN
jgi:hypothetical protein